MRFLIIIIFVSLSSRSMGQKESKNITNNISKVNNLYSKKVINNFYNKNRDTAPVLNISRYIDFNKLINIYIGSNNLPVSGISLIEGIDIFGILGFQESGFFTLKLMDNKLKLSADLNSFDDKYIARIRENRLITKEKYYISSNDSSLEIYDEYFFPCLQIQFFKKYNCIYIGGAFNAQTGYVICNFEKVVPNFHKDKLFMRQAEKDSFFREYQYYAKQVRPLELSQKEISRQLDKLEKITYKRNEILNSVSNMLCNCFMKQKDSIINIAKYNLALEACVSKITKGKIVQLFTEQGEDMHNHDSVQRIKDLITNRMSLNCSGFGEILIKIINEGKRRKE